MSLSSEEEHMLVSRYIKQNTYSYIPDDVILYISIWFTTHDSFSKEFTSDFIKIFDNDLIVTRIQDWDGYHYNAFGSDIIGIGQKKIWKLKIIDTATKYNSCIQIGIIESTVINNNMTGSFCQMAHFNGYGCYAKNGRLFHKRNGVIFLFLFHFFTLALHLAC